MTKKTEMKRKMEKKKKQVQRGRVKGDGKQGGEERGTHELHWTRRETGCMRFTFYYRCREKGKDEMCKRKRRRKEEIQ